MTKSVIYFLKPLIRSSSAFLCYNQLSVKSWERHRVVFKIKSIGCVDLGFYISGDSMGKPKI